MSIRSLLLGAICAAWSCSDVLPVDRFVAPIKAWRLSRNTDRVVLVVLDGVRWQDVFDRSGNMPTLEQWTSGEGTCVKNIRATGPNYVSLPSYTEIFSGRSSVCQDNECPRTKEPTLVDEIGKDAVVVSSWESIEHAATPNDDAPLTSGRFRTHRSDWFDKALLDEAREAGPGPGIGEFRRDAYTAQIAIRALEAHAPRFMFVGLGEPDEYAHRGERENYRASLHEADRWIAAIEAAAGERTAIFVTTDHGRNAAFRDHGGGWPESGQSWLVAKGASIGAHGCMPTSSHRLADIAPTIRLLLALSPDTDAASGRPIDELF